ncbi:unnamed protein product, partial [Brassica oleracea var. botrytis]
FRGAGGSNLKRVGVSVPSPYHSTTVTWSCTAHSCMLLSSKRKVIYL